MDGRKISFALACAAAALALLIGCGHFGGRSDKMLVTQSGNTSVQREAPSSDGRILPDVMELDHSVAADRTVSAEQTVTSEGWDAFVNGQTWTNGTSGSNVEVDGTALTLRAFSEGEYSYAIYGQAIGADPKPLQTLISSEVCSFGGGRDDEVPLFYVIGIADYTIDSWRWFGPFDLKDIVVTVNSASLRSRFKSPSNNFYLCVLTSSGKAVSSYPADGNAADFPFEPFARGVSQAGDSAVGLTIKEIITTTDNNLETDPAVVTGLTTSADVGGVDISWDRNFDPDVFLYQVFRDDLDDPDLPVLLVGVNAPVVTYRDETGVPGKEYLYLVRARNDAGFGGMSLQRGTRKLAAPSVTASNPDVDNIRLSWDAVTGAVNGYRLYRAASPTDTPAVFYTADSSTLAFNDNAPPMDTGMWYWVQPLGEDVDGPLGGPGRGIRPMLVPLEMMATAGDFPGYVELAWADDGTAEEFRIYRDTDADEAGAVYVNSVFPGMSREGIFTYNDTAAPWATDMYYFVKPVVSSVEGARGEGDWGRRGLTIPQNVSATQGTDALHVKVNWDAVNHATRYKVFRSDNPADPAPPEIAEVAAPLTTYSDSPPGWGSTEGLKYYYWVCALHSGPDTECSDLSLYAEGGCALGTPQNVKASDGLFPNKVVITWSTVSQADGYKIYRDSGFLAQVNAPGVTYTDNTVVLGTQYSYAVSAFVASGEGGKSVPDIGFAAVPPVASLTADPTKGDAPLTVSFDASASYDPDGSIVKYEWDWSNDGTYELDSGTDPTVSCQYADPGNHTCRLRATDNNGATGVATISITSYIAEWVHTWGGSGGEGLLNLEADEFGNVYGVGGFSSTSSIATIAKYDPNGDVIWRKSWGGSAEDYPRDLALSQDGNLYVVGGTKSFGAGDWDIFLLKYTLSGALIWQRTWGGTNYDVPYMMDIDNNGDIYIGGSTDSFGAGSYDQFILKYSSSGTLLWQRTWGGTDHENAEALAVDIDNNVYAGGLTFSYGAGYYDVLLTKFTSSGEFVWARTWGGVGAERSMGVDTDANGFIYITGYTGSFGSESSAYLLKYSPEGSILWQYTYGGSTQDYGYCLDTDAAGFSVIGCQVVTLPENFTDIAVLRCSPSGELLWQSLWDSSDTDNPSGIEIGFNGKIFVCGGSYDAFGAWSDPGWSATSVNGTVTSPVGTVTTPSGVQTTPSGEEGEPTGITDTGGGEMDQLIMKIDTSG